MTPGTTTAPETPSLFYRGGLWRLGLSAARVLPQSLLEQTGRFLASAYCALHRVRRETVVSNLLPPLGMDRALASAAARRLFRNFGVKLADLWRHESGQPIDHLLPPSAEWPEFSQYRSSGRGLLLVTPHIGNWEFGSALLQRQGVNLMVITQAEPQRRFTELRAESRRRHGIETLVVGEDPFAFVQVIRRLDEGAVVALLIDRPIPAAAAPATLFGRPFAASRAPAELARASGCALVPVVLPRAGSRYSAHVLPEIACSRVALGSRAARDELTRQIMLQFEPVIRQYADQWYHFVPLWRNVV